MSLEAHRPARLRDRARARARPGGRLQRADRRDRRRQVHPRSMHCNWRWAPGPTPAWCAKAPRGADISAEFDLPPALAPLAGRGRLRSATTACCCAAASTARARAAAWINGSPATATQLRELADQLVDIHGQHAWQSLTRPEAVRGLLDAYAGVSTQALQQLWQRWRGAQKTLADARAAQDSLQRERERLAWQIAEVDKLAPGERRMGRAQHQPHPPGQRAVAARSSAGRAAARWKATTAAPRARCRRRQALLQGQEHVEPAFRELAQVLASSLAQAEDAAHSLHGYLRKTDLDPAAPGRTGRAHVASGCRCRAATSARRRSCPALLASLEGGTGQARCRRRPGRAGSRREEGGRRLHGRSPRAVARPAPRPRRSWPRPSRRPCRAWACRAAASRSRCRQLDAAGASGLEEISFLVAGHAGSTPRPVGKVASGGELSRIALAIAVTTSRLGTAQTLIFDEVDAGVGGAVAETVGRLMKQLGRDRQVLAVTHLPQVAACADHHLVVAKQQRTPAGPSSTVSRRAGRAARGRSRAHAGRRAPVGHHAGARQGNAGRRRGARQPVKS